MPSHFSTIGIAVRSNDEFADYAIRTVDQGRALDTPGGSYIVWDMGGGAELWAQVDGDSSLIGLNPHFRGLGRMEVRLDHTVERASDSPLDGAFYGWAEPSDDAEAQGAYPLVFDVPDMLAWGELALPATRTVQISAFAHDIAVFADDAAYRAAQSSQSLMAEESFIPAGLFPLDGDPNAAPRSEAVFSGHVLATQVLTNAQTGEEFAWAHVQTYGGTVDVVVDPALLAAPLVVGGVVRGSFWLSGRVVRWG